MTNEAIDNNEAIVGITYKDYNKFSLEIESSRITFKKSKIIGIWEKYNTVEATLDPHNTLAYSFAVHETMHAMGFKHINDRKSILNSKLYAFSSDFTEYDKQLIDKYNVQFYDAEPTYIESETECSECANNM